MLKWNTHAVGGVRVITLEPLEGVSDDRQSEERQALYRTIQERADPRFAVDLGRVEYMSSADIGFLITLRRRTDVRKGKLVLFDVNPYIRNSLATMKLLPLFPIADDLTGAAAAPAHGRLLRVAWRVVGLCRPVRTIRRSGPPREREFRR